MKTLIDKHKSFLIVVVLVSLVLVNLLIVNQKPKVVEKQVVEKSKTESASTNNRIKVDLKGCVNTPGVYEFLDYQRVIDAIEKAGGLTEQADTTNINLSKKLEDEMVVYIYSKEQVEQLKAASTKEEQEQIVATIENQLETFEPVKEKVIDGKISINNATAEELMMLPKIGESKAQAIIEYREKQPFDKLEDLLNVSGIGEATYELLKDQIVL